jgi:hypothetical protein
MYLLKTKELELILQIVNAFLSLARSLQIP